MLRNIIGAGAYGSVVLEWVGIAALVIEILAVTIIVVAVFYAIGKFLFRAGVRREKGNSYYELKVSLAKSLLLGLEVLVAADVVRTVALEATLQAVAVLGLLVLIRIVLSWSLIVEIEGRWPWQGKLGARETEHPTR
jgi:uncharacterized membrane protein